ncbi:MAG: transposase [Steroidobacteraceae bacterium]
MSNTKEVRTVEMYEALRKRRSHSDEFKKRLVAEAKEPGKSVAMIAWLNHLPASQLHKWVQKFGGES